MGSPLRKRIRDTAYNITGNHFPRVHEALSALRRPCFPVDPSVRYPSYKSFDEFIDVDRLRSLDGYLTERIKRHAAEEKPEIFDTGLLKVSPFKRRNPGSRQIFLSRTDSEVYQDLNNPDLWRPSEFVDEFGELMDFIQTLPFERTARMLIMYDLKGRAVTAHRDHIQGIKLHEFVWFRTNLDKPFHVMDWNTKERKDIESYSAWFDTVNQYHGSDSSGKFGFTIRVDGIFTEEFRARIPKPPINPSSTPSYWASLEAAERAKPA